MKIRVRLIVATAVMALLASSPSVAASKDDTATVGWFLKEVAVARGLNVADEASAAQALRIAGISVPTLDPAKTLTEGDVVAIGRSLGVTTTTQNPNATFSQKRARSFLATFQPEVGGLGDGSNTPQDIGGDPNENSNNGKGKKKGHNKSSSEPL